MSESAQPAAANHLVFEGNGVSGVLDTTSIRGTPTGAVTVDGASAAEVTVARDPLGWRLSGSLAMVPDLSRTSVTVLVPEVNVTGEPESFIGVAIVSTARTGFAGPAFVNGSLNQYDVRQLTGSASAVAF